MKKLVYILSMLFILVIAGCDTLKADDNDNDGRTGEGEGTQSMLLDPTSFPSYVA